MWRATVAMLFVLGPSLLGAQAQGSVRGKVTSASSNAPLGNAQVFVVGTTLGGVSGADGSYSILAVPPGAHVVRVRLIGYAPTEKSVTVTAGTVTTLDFALTQSAVSLDEVVVTGTGGSARKREVGNSIGQIKVADAPEVTTNLSNMLSGRIAGVTVGGNVGNSGGGSAIRLRGSTSVALTNQPLIYIDGVRTRSDEYPRNGIFTGTTQRGANSYSSPLNDINPDDIESVEIVKGPAAASLYGADASAGVIQIITKRGKIGQQSFQQTVRYEYGDVNQNWAPPSNFANCSAAAVAPTSRNPLCIGKVGTTTVGTVTTLGTLVSDNPLVRTGAFRTGNDRIVSWNGRGGGQNYSFFISGTMDDNRGTLPNNSFTRYNGRANFQISPNDQWRVDVNVGFIRSKAVLPDNDNNIYGFLGGGLLGTPNSRDSTANPSSDGWFGFARQVNAVESIQNTQLTNRGIFGVVANYTPVPWFTNRLTLGADLIRDEVTKFFPKNSVGQYAAALNNGSNGQTRLGFERYTLDYLGNMRGNWGAQNQWETNVSFGVQTISSRNESLGATGQGFIVNSNNTVGSASSTSGTQNYAEQTQYGILGQLQVAYRNRIILTAANRVDKFSSFGKPDESFNLPKLGVSYVISEESWFRLPAVSNLRLRAAWGQTGRSPGAGAALTTFSAAPYAISSTGSAAGAIPNNPGNGNLKAERGEEVEFGADFGILKDRVNFELTYFNKDSKDLLLQQPLAPSLGFQNNPFRNLGAVNNNGIEFAVNAQMYRSPNFAWDLRWSMNTVENKVTDLGGINPFFQGFVGQIKNGLPLGAMVTKKIISINQVTGVVTVDTAFTQTRKPLPGFEASLFNSVRLGKYVTVTASIDTKRDFGIYNLTDFFRETQLVRSDNRLDTLKLSRLERLRRYGNPTPGQPAFVQLSGAATSVNEVREYFIQPGDFVRFRELGVNLTLPTDWARKIRAAGGSITFALNNVAIWTDYVGVDPEVLTNIASPFDRSEFLTVPNPKRATIRVNLQY